MKAEGSPSVVPADTTGSWRIDPVPLEALPELARLARVIWQAHYPGIITQAQIDYMLDWMYDVNTMRREIEQEGVVYLGLWRGQQLLGFAAYGPTVEGDTFKLHKLYVHPDWQRRGFGSRLLQRVETDLRAKGVRRMVLNVNKRNTKAIAAYRKNGFVIARATVDDIGHGFVMDDFIMEKTLA